MRFSQYTHMQGETKPLLFIPPSSQSLFLLNYTLHLPISFFLSASFSVSLTLAVTHTLL